jgi:hypothetical protein
MFVFVVAASAIALDGACSLSSSDAGEECGENGSTEHCEHGSICSSDSECTRALNACEDRDGNMTCDTAPKCNVSSADEPRCRKICKDHTDCPKGYGCHSVWLSGKKSCQPDEDTD